MAKITLKGNEVETSGELPKVGSEANQFTLVKKDLSEAHLEDFGDKIKILNIFPSVDTGTCALSVKQFNKLASEINNSIVLCISKDLPFALTRFCGAEGIENVETLSAFRSDFSQEYGLEILTGPLKGLCSRAIVILDGDNKVIYCEQVQEIANEPNYEKALAAITNLE